MADVDGTVISKGYIDPLTDDPVVLAAEYDNVAKVYTLKVQATGVTFNGTLDPTNLAIETGNLQILVKALAPSINAVQKVAVDTAHAETGLAIGKTLVMLVSTVACCIVIADAPVATAADFYLPANTPMVFTCATTNLVSVIKIATAGSLFVTALN